MEVFNDSTKTLTEMTVWVFTWTESCLMILFTIGAIRFLTIRSDWNSTKLTSYFICLCKTYSHLLFQTQTSDCSHCILLQSSLGCEIRTWWLALGLWWWHWVPWTSWRSRWAAHAPGDREEEKGNEAALFHFFLETFPS